ALIEEGARLMRVAASTCTARASVVSSGSRSITYAEIVRRGRLDRRYSPEELSRLPLKKPSEWRLIGRNIPALDVPAKVDGSGLYGIDARVDGMVYARP